MAESRSRRGFKNVAYGLLGQAVVLGLSLLVPRLFILHFGSEVNGLLSVVTQVFAYFALLEAGLSTSIMTALYRPIVDNDRRGIGAILSAAQHYFRRVALAYLVCTIGFAVMYSTLNTSGISPSTVFWVIILQGAAGAVNYLYQAAFRQFMTADGKAYVLSNVSLASAVVLNAARLIAIYLGYSVVVVQWVALATALLQVPFYMLYLRRGYPWLVLNGTPDYGALRQRSWILGHQISSMIFNFSDIVIVSWVCGLAVASVYSVYRLVMSGVNSLVATLNNSLIFIVGQKYHESVEECRRLFDAYNMVYVTLVVALMNVCSFLLIPFVRIYTEGADVNYVVKYLPVLLCGAQVLSSARTVASNLITVAGRFRETIWRTIAETSINLFVSIVCVQIVGVYGVVIGTLAALAYRTNDMMIYSNRKILGRPALSGYGALVVGAALYVVGAVLSLKCAVRIESLAVLVGVGIAACAVTLLVGIAVVAVFCRAEVAYVIPYVRRAVRRTA